MQKLLSDGANHARVDRHTDRQTVRQTLEKMRFSSNQHARMTLRKCEGNAEGEGGGGGGGGGGGAERNGSLCMGTYPASSFLSFFFMDSSSTTHHHIDNSLYSTDRSRITSRIKAVYLGKTDTLNFQAVKMLLVL